LLEAEQVNSNKQSVEHDILKCKEDFGKSFTIETFQNCKKYICNNFIIDRTFPEESILYKIATNKKKKLSCSDFLNSTEGESNDRLGTEDVTDVTSLELHVNYPLTESKVLKILQKNRTSHIKIQENIVKKIKKTLQQKCRRIFKRCCKLLFPTPKQSKRNNNNNTSNNNNNNSNNNTMNERNNNINNNDNNNNVVNGTNNISSERNDNSFNSNNNNNNATINERNNNRSEDDHDSSDTEEYEKNNRIVYPFQKLLSELKGK